MKKVLCISPHFPPINAADMHRLRQSIPYFKLYSWKPVCFVVRPKYVEQIQEKLLLESLLESVEIHYVNAFSADWTRKVGLGNLGFRAFLQYKRAVDQYLESNDVDLIYFSTTVFTLMALGPHWKKKYAIPFVVDLQDPWRNDYYLSIDKGKRPRKFWFDYRQKKYLEGRTMPEASGIISVSHAYIETMKVRYPVLKSLNCLTLPFSVLEADWDIARKIDPVDLGLNTVNVVYVGRAGNDMRFAVGALFNAFKSGLDRNLPGFTKVRFFFFGTSYAVDGQGVKTIEPIAKKFGIEKYVEELTDRLPYFKSLRVLDSADMLFMPGSDDEGYTASKVFPYILAKKPLFAIFNQKSSVVDILKSTNGGKIVTFSSARSIDGMREDVLSTFNTVLSRLPYTPEVDFDAFAPYTAKEMTKKQCEYFDEILKKFRLQRFK